MQAPLRADPAPYEQVIMDATERLVNGIRLQQQAIKQDPQIAYRLVENTVLPHIDFERISRWVLGKHWRRATPEQQQDFSREFTAFLTRTYVTAMVNYVDEIVSNADGLSYPPGNEQLGEHQAQVLPEHEHPAGDGLAQDRVDGAPLELLPDEGDPQEDGDDRGEEVHRPLGHPAHHPRLVADGDLLEHEREEDGAHREEEDRVQDAVPHGFAEGVGGDGGEADH